MNNSIARVSAIVVGVLIGLGVTWGLLVLLKDDQSVEHPGPTESEESLPKESTVDSTNETNAEKSEPQSIPDQVTDLTIPLHLFDQKEAITSWIAILDEDKILDWLEQSTQQGWDVSQVFLTEFQKALVQKLSRTKPVKALEFAMERMEPVRSTLGSAVFFEWASNDLDAAIEYAKTAEILSELDRYWLLYSILQSQDGLTREQQEEITRELGDESYALTYYFQSLLTDKIDDPKDLWHEIVGLVVQDNSQHIEILEAVANAWIDQEGLEIFDQISASIEDRRTLESVAFGVLYGRADDPKQIPDLFEYVFNLHDDFPWKDFTLNSIIGAWTRHDPDAALLRTETLPPSNFRNFMIREVYQEKAKRQPNFILANLDSVPAAHLEYTAQTAVRTLATKSPTEAVGFVMQIEDAEFQQELATTLVYAWIRSDLNAAKDWVLSLPADTPLRDELLEPLSNSLIDTDPQLAFDLALQQSLNQQANNPLGHEVSVLGRIASTDIELAMELLPKVREGSRSAANRRIAGALVGQGDSARALSLINELSDSEQLEHYQESLWSWIETDPKGLIKNVNLVESDEVRAQVAVMITSMNVHNNAYTTEELKSLERFISEEILEAMKQFEEQSTP